MGWLLVGRFVVDVVGLSSYRQNVSIVQRQNDEDRTYILLRHIAQKPNICIHINKYVCAMMKIAL